MKVQDSYSKTEKSTATSQKNMVPITDEEKII